MTLTLIFTGITVLTSIFAWNKPEWYHRWIHNPYETNRKKQYYRLLTSGFIHADWMHLFFNMFTFYFFGSRVEQIFESLFGGFGLLLFASLYLLGIVLSDLHSFFMHKHNPGYNSLGASGGVAAILFAAILFQPLEKICIYGILCLPGFILGVLFLIYAWYEGKRKATNINHLAHFYGAMFGVVFCILIYPRVLEIFWVNLTQWNGF